MFKALRLLFNVLCFPWKDPTDDDFEPTIKKLSDAKGHLEMSDTDSFSKDVLDSNDGKKSCDFSQLAVRASVRAQVRVLI